MTTFDDYTIDDARTALNDLYTADTRAELDASDLYMQGDHWQLGAEWRGPTPIPGTLN